LPHPHFENQSANVAHPANDDSDQQQKEPLPVFPATSIFPTMEDDSHVNVAPKSSQAHFDNQSGNVADPGNDDSDDQQKDPFPVLPAASLFPATEDDSHVNVAQKSSQIFFCNATGTVCLQ